MQSYQIILDWSYYILMQRKTMSFLTDERAKRPVSLPCTPRGYNIVLPSFWNHSQRFQMEVFGFVDDICLSMRLHCVRLFLSVVRGFRWIRFGFWKQMGKTNR